MRPRPREKILAYGVMDPAMTAELAADPPRADPYHGRGDHAAARAHRAATLREKHHLRYVPGPVPDAVGEQDRWVPVRGAARIRVRVYTPLRRDARGRPLVVMFHEGGWSMGDLSDEETNCRLLARELGAVCVNVEYRWDALQWAAANASALGADPGQGFVIGGGSAGGNIAAVLAHIARDEGLTPPLTGQYLCVPAITCFALAEAIPERYRDEYLSHPLVTPNIDPVLRGVESEEQIAGLFRDILKADMQDPRIVPFLYGEGGSGHTGVPPAYLQVCGLDPLRDEGLIYERVLREEAGVQTRLDVYPGFGHYFWTNFPNLKRSREFVEDTIRGVRWLLEPKLKG
ncbi:putative lipase/esterase [Xylariomycetidae sp. FL0641]|nr:putative lipase/esterase [Xylariomycetidae sp. FL0641]